MLNSYVRADLLYMGDLPHLRCFLICHSFDFQHRLTYNLQENGPTRLCRKNTTKGASFTQSITVQAISTSTFNNQISCPFVISSFSNNSSAFDCVVSHFANG